MTMTAPDVLLSPDPAQLKLDWVVPTLQASYWGGKRTAETWRRAIAASLVWGAYATASGQQLGFARVVTDGATFSWLCDVIVDPAYRGRGIGRRLLAAVVEDPRLAGTTFRLATRDAHEWYAAQGFARDETMRRPAATPG